MVSFAISCPLPLSQLLSLGFGFPRDDAKAVDEDGTLRISDELLILIFQSRSLSRADKKSISLVCRRWYKVEGCSRQGVCLRAQEGLIHHLPSLLSRFDYVTKLALVCPRDMSSVDDEALVMVSKKCRKLTSLALGGCLRITDDGMTAIAKNCAGLKELDVWRCKLGAAGFNSVLSHCSVLEDLTVYYLLHTEEFELIGTGVVASSLQSISLSMLHNGVGQYFAPLIVGSKKLKKLHLSLCVGDWETVFSSIGKNNSNLEHLHLDHIILTDAGLAALASCSSLEVLHIAKMPLCTDAGISAIVEGCLNLRELRIDGYKTDRIGDNGLLAVAQHCPNIQELALFGLNPTPTSLTAIASNCLKLGQMTFCECNVEIACMAEKCASLRKLSMKQCPISDEGLRSLAYGFPSLQEVDVLECKGVRKLAVARLKQRRVSLSIWFQPKSDLLDAFAILDRKRLKVKVDGPESI